MRHHHEHPTGRDDEIDGHPGRRHHDDHRSGRGEDPSGPRGGRGRGHGPRGAGGSGGRDGDPRDGFDEHRPPHRPDEDRDARRRGRFDPRDSRFDPRGSRFDPRGGFGPGRGRGPRDGRGPDEGFGPGDVFGPGEGSGPRGGGHRGHGGRGPGGRGRGGHGRRPRGEVRTAVLLLLAEEPMHGYQLMQTIGDRTGGRWAPSPGAVYPTLSQLEDEGLVLTAKEGGRKLAELTEAGRAHVEEHRAGWSDPFATGDDGADELPDVRSAMHDLGGAVREAARGADAAQLTAVAGILAEARRSVYRVLAGDHTAPSGADAPGSTETPGTTGTGTDPTAPSRETGDPADADPEGPSDGTPAA